MQWIPVLDLAGGRVVHARRGERERYAPVRSALVDGCEPLAVARALVEAAQATTLYVADLDALQGRAPQAAVLAGLCSGLGGLQLWVDGGFASAAAARAALEPLAVRPGDQQRLRPVFGSESFRRTEALAAALQPGACGDLGAPLLSLDRRGTALGAAAAWDEPHWWPQDVIVMTLDAVGAEAGPDLATFAQVRAAAGPARRVHGAGGVRDAADLQRGAAAGADGWLVATALHRGLRRA